MRHVQIFPMIFFLRVAILDAIRVHFHSGNVKLIKHIETYCARG